MALNTQQEMFCREFIACKYNGGKAYEKVYATKKNDSARAGAVRLMKMPEIKERISQLEKEIFEANHITPEHIANELSEMAFGEDTPQNIKLKALDVLQKQTSLQTQKVQADLNNNIQVNVTGE